MEKNKILIDWLSLTTTISRASDLIKLLGMEHIPFENIDGIMGYQGFTKRLYFNGINIHYESHKEKVNYVWLEMSGQGCRAFESLSTHADYNILFQYVLGNPVVDGNGVRITRLDIAYDDFEGLLDMPAIVQYSLPDINNRNLHYYISPFRAFDIDLSDRGSCVTIGSCRSDVLFRIYDKAAERNREDEIDHWVRCEIQLRRDRANEFIRLLVCENEVIDDLYFAVLNHYLRFVEPSNDSNKSRWATASHWEKFATSRTDRTISLFVKPGLDYNVLKLRHYVVDMAGGACYTYMKMFGVENFFKECVKQHINTLNPKYKRLLGEYDEFIKNQKDDILEDLEKDSMSCL